jgi:hypothetical protein
VYWFRYTCLLIVHSAQADCETNLLASRIRLNYTDVRDRLRGAAPGGTALDSLFESLEGDFAVLKDLLEAAPEAGSLERRMLMINYYLIRAHFHLARKYSDARARHALTEMTTILRFFACTAAAGSRY